MTGRVVELAAQEAVVEDRHELAREMAEGDVAAHPAGSVTRVNQWKAFFRRFKGVGPTMGGHIIPLSSSPWGTAMVEFLEFIIDTGRFSSKWWNEVDRIGEVQPSLTAWYWFDKRVKLNPPGGLQSRAASKHAWSTYVWHRYPGKGIYKACYCGGTNAQAWRAHQLGLWEGVLASAKYRSSETYWEQVVMWKVLVNVEWYYRHLRDFNPFLGVARVIGGYPRRYPATAWQACRMADMSVWPAIADHVRKYFGPPPRNYKKRCGVLF